MRDIFIEELILATKKNKNIILLVNDLGFGIIEDFCKKFPNNYFNAGVSEQSMMGYAAGLAARGKHVFVYSIANFPTFRCAEQIRNDVDYHNLPVTIVSVGAGVGYGNLGYSHHALQDYSLMRSFPNMEIVSPSNNEELVNAMQYIFKNHGPKYLRLDKDKIVSKLPVKKKTLKPGQWVLIKKGTVRKAILLTGSCLAKAFSMQKKRRYKNYYIFSLPIWSMKSKKSQLRLLKKFSEVLVLENHFEDGGFSSWLREAKGHKLKTRIRSISISPEVTGKVGNKDFLENFFLNS